MKGQYRAWCFTLNNYTSDEEEHIKNMTTYEYMIFGHEIAPKTGTPHLQGYVYFKNARSMESLKKRMNPRCHYEPARGSPSQNDVYCSKEATDIFERGIKPSQGRAKFSLVQSAIQDPIENFTVFHQYRKAYHEAKALTYVPHDFERQVYVCTEDQSFDIADYYESQDMTVCYDNEYHDEDVVFVSCTGPVLTKDRVGFSEESIKRWMRKRPEKIRVGYELKIYDPKIIIFFYTIKQEENSHQFLKFLFSKYKKWPIEKLQEKVTNENSAEPEDIVSDEAMLHH